jgi:hypothetical protein
VERDDDRLLGSTVDESQVNEVTDVKLVVLYGFGGDEDRVGSVASVEINEAAVPPLK